MMMRSGVWQASEGDDGMYVVVKCIHKTYKRSIYFLWYKIAEVVFMLTS